MGNSKTYRFLRIGLIVLSAMVLVQFAGFQKAVAAQPEFIYARGEISGGNYIYSDEWIGLMFREPLQNDEGQATKAIQKAADRAFGWWNTEVTTTDNKNFIITMRSKIERADAGEIILREGSIKDARTKTGNGEEIIIPVQPGDYTPITAPAQRREKSSSPHEPTPTAPPPGPPPTPALPPTTTQKQQYAVVRGDALWLIAERFYGDGNLWVRIFEANKSLIKNPHMIFPGQVLDIPPKQ